MPLVLVWMVEWDCRDLLFSLVEFVFGCKICCVRRTVFQFSNLTLNLLLAILDKYEVFIEMNIGSLIGFRVQSTDILP